MKKEEMSKIKYVRHAEARTRADKIFDAVNLTLVLLVVFVCAYPLYYTVVASFSDPNAVIGGKVYLWPIDVTLDSYRSVIKYSQVWIGYRNTLFYATLGTLYNLFLLLPASYGLSRKSQYTSLISWTTPFASIT